MQNWLLWHIKAQAKAQSQSIPTQLPLLTPGVIYFGEDCPTPLLSALSNLEPEKPILLQHPLRKSPTTTTPAQILVEWDLLRTIYEKGEIPPLDTELRVDLFNTLRFELFPKSYPMPLTLHSDARGSLFETVRAHQSGQAFISTSKPGIVRGNHFHLHKVERFCVIQGKATIRLRKLFTDAIIPFQVTSQKPCLIDIPTLHTHDILNTGDSELITLFWSNEFFDPKNSDTWSENVE